MSLHFSMNLATLAFDRAQKYLYSSQLDQALDEARMILCFLATRLESFSLAIPSSSDCAPLSQASRWILSLPNPIVWL
jgi:hypothetical protein